MEYYSVIEVSPLENYCLRLKFENEETKIFDMSQYLDIGLFKKLRNEQEFKKVRVCFDSIQWENGLDIDPEILYEKGKKIENNKLE